MYEQEFQGETLYMMLYAVVAALNLVACCYLLFRRANAIAPNVTPPVRLRRWTAAFFAFMTLSHLWYMPSIYLTSSEDKMLCYDIGGMLDCMTTFPLAIVILFTMLQDRRRPLWLAFVMVIPLVVLLALNLGTHDEAFLPMFHAYLLLLAIGLTIYMIHEVRRYGCWLRDNYADLEHKEVWQSFVVLAVMLLGFGIYSFEIGGLANKYIVQVNNIILICYLLWRVESLSDLSISQQQSISAGLSAPSSCNNIGPLLQMHCIDTQLYLQHDLSLIQLAKAIGTNRTYLSQYFSNQNITYNAYINHLRINHFIRLYHKAVAAQRFFTAQQLALESGYHSYRTFSEAFKRQTGQSVTVWMKAANKQEQSQTYLDSAERKLTSPEGKAENEGLRKS